MGVVGGILDKLSECVVIDSSLCSRVRHKASACNACIETCANNAVSITRAGGKVVINNERCRGCGKCLAVCPNGVFRLKTAEKTEIDRQISAQIEQTGGITVSCDGSNDDEVVTLRSLAFVNRHFIMRAVRKGAKSMRLLHGECGRCSKGGCLELVDRELALCERIFAEAGIEIPVSVDVYVKKDKKPDNDKGEIISRREFFTFLKKKAADKVGEAVFSLAESEINDKKTVFTAVSGAGTGNFTADIRSIGGTELLDRLVSGGVLRSVLLNKDTCTRCGVCARVCPFGVLSCNSETVKGKEIINNISIDPYACTGCGVCALSCMTRSITVL